VFVFAVLVFAASHKVEKTRHTDVDFLLVRKAAAVVAELALSQRVVDAGFSAEVVGKPAFVALGAVVLVVEFAADFLGGFGLDDLALDGVGEEAVEAVLAVPHVEVNARIVASLHVVLEAFSLTGAFVDCEVLVRAQILDIFQLVF
jgi:hypothetical protein